MVYMAKAPGNPSDWDGSGNVWFKIDEWGPNFNYGSISWPQLGTGPIISESLACLSPACVAVALTLPSFC
jgi:hypothetical protein